MGRSALPLLASAVAILGIAQSASACSIMVPPDRSVAEWRKVAHSAIDRATAIIDGEVVRPFIEGKQNAIVRAVHVLKGSQQELFEVGAQDSCSIALVSVGERMRMLLSGGPSVYDLGIDDSDARYVDRILKSDRRTVWPYFAGSPPESASH